MKKFLTTTAMFAAMMAGTTANAQDWYASVFAGATTGGSLDTGYSDDYMGSTYGVDLSAEFDNSYILGVTVGMQVGSNLRAEAELSYAKYAVDKTKISYSGYSYSYDAEDGDDVGVTYLMGNLWYDIPQMAGGMAMTPYVGGGIGLARVTGESDGPDFDDSNGFAYQIGGGVQFPVGAGAIDVGYRYKAVTGITLEVDGVSQGVDDADLDSNHFQIAYQMKF